MGTGRGTGGGGAAPSGRVGRIGRMRRMPLKEKFEKYAEKAKTLTETTTNENKLILYGLYKQSTVGPVNTSRSGIFSEKERAEWDAWKAVEGKSKDDAMRDYITKVKQLQSCCFCLNMG